VSELRKAIRKMIWDAFVDARLRSLRKEQEAHVEDEVEAKGDVDVISSEDKIMELVDVVREGCDKVRELFDKYDVELSEEDAELLDKFCKDVEELCGHVEAQSGRTPSIPPEIEERLRRLAAYRRRR